MPLLSRKQAIEYLKIESYTLDSLRKRQVLPVTMIGRLSFFDTRDLDAWLESGKSCKPKETEFFVHNGHPIVKGG
jgi:hypothetical protein